jgi:peptidyl-prolyl cis-trans isomerase C
MFRISTRPFLPACVLTLMAFTAAASERSIIAVERSVEASNELRDDFDKAVATQANEQITIGDMAARVDRVTPGKRLSGLRDPKTLTAELDTTFTSRVMANEARRLGLHESALFKREMKLLEEQVLARRLLHAKLPDYDAPKLEQAAKEQYRIRKSEFNVPEAREISHIHISLSGRTRADALVKALEIQSLLAKSGSSFDALAAAHSDDKSSADKGGLLGDLAKGSGAEMEAAVFAMPSPGLLATPVETPAGFHIIKLNKITPARTKPFEEVKGVLVEEITQNASRVTRQNLVNALIGTKPFEIDEAGMERFFQIMGADEHALFQEADPKAAAAARARAAEQ